MPKSSRHKSHKQSKHSSRDYSDSEDDVVKTKEKSSKDDGSTRGHRDSASGEKRKISFQLREGKDSKDLSGHGNDDVLEEYVSSKRRKEKADVSFGGDRWNGGGEERGDSERHVEKESLKGEVLKVDVMLKENSSKGESLIVESKSKSKHHDSGFAVERKEDSLVSVVVEKVESKSKGESKRKSERDSSSRKEGKESKDKDRRSDKEKNRGLESKSGDAEVKLVDMDVGKKQGTQFVDLSGERQSKRARENNERTSLDELKNPELDKNMDKKIRKKREGSGEREKYYDEPKESAGRRVSSKGDRAKDSKHRDDKHKDGGYPDKYQEDGYKDDRQRDDKYREEGDKENKHHDEKYQEDGERDSRRRDDKHREDGDRDGRQKDEKHRDDGERDSRRKDDKYHEVIEREAQREDKYHEDGDRDYRRKDDRNHEDIDKDIRHGDERYYEDGDREDRRKDSSYRDDGDRDYRHKDDKYREDTERDIRYKDSKDVFDREKRSRDSKYRDERASRDRTGDKSDSKRSRDDCYAADPHVRKSSAYDDSPTRDCRATRYRDDQGRRRANEKEEYSDVKSRLSKDQRSDAEKKSVSSARMDSVTDRVGFTSRNVDVELTSGHARRRSSPTSNSHAPRDNYRVVKQDDTKYREYNYEDRSRHNMNSTTDYHGPFGGSDKTSSSRSLDKLGQKDDAHFGDTPAERRLKSDIRSPPMKLLDKSPSSSVARRQFTRPDTRRNIDIDESTQRSGGSRAEELAPVDADTLSISSPFARNSQHFSSNSKSFPPPPPTFRTGGVDSPSLLGSGEGGRNGKSNMRHRRMGDHNMGRMQGNNAWRGVPSWPSPVPNGFLPFPHASPFHSVMQPFHAPPMFGVRPSMELNHHHSPYHMPPDADRFSGPGRPMGWRNPVDDSCPPQLHGWDTSNAVFGDESYMYGRPEWDHPRNMSGGRGWETSSDLLEGPNRTASLEMILSEKENNNNAIRSGDDEALDGQSVHQTLQSDQTRVDQHSDSVVQSKKSAEKNEIGDSVIFSSGDSGEAAANVSGKDDVPFCHVYLSKLDISAELAESELYDKCAGLIDMDKIMCSGIIDDSKILYMEDAEDKMASPGLLSFALFASTDDSVFKKSVSLYKIQKEHFLAEYGEKPKAIPNSNQEDISVQEDKTEKLCPTDGMDGVEDKTETLQENINGPAGNIITDNPEEPVSALDIQMQDAEDKPLPEEGCDVPLGTACINDDELKSLDTNYAPLLNSDMSPEAMMPESVNLSRIHDHSPEKSTH